MRKRMVAGERFGRLTTVSAFDRTPSGKIRWLCQCVCGGETVAAVSGLRSGDVTSCGCYQKEVLTRPRRHGEAARSGKSAQYLIYRGMIRRCYNKANKSYHRYGGRGIAVCERWLNSFTDFLEDVGRRPSPAHSLDRYPDPDGNYEPGNCRWATQVEQQNNRTNNRIVIRNGQRMTLTQLAEMAVVDAPTLAYRLDRGWDIEDAISLSPSPLSRQRRASTPIDKWKGWQ